MAEEVVRVDADPEELAELGRDHDQRDPVDVAEQHRLAEEVRHEPQPERAREEEQETHRQRQRRCERRIARRVGLASDHRHRRHRHRGQRRERGVRPDHVLPRRPEQPVDRERQERPVEAVDDRQPGELRHRQRRGHCDRSDRDSRHEIGPEVRARVAQAASPAPAPPRPAIAERARARTRPARRESRRASRHGRREIER